MSKICGKILKQKNQNPLTKKIGGPRYACDKEAGHTGECNFEYMTQVEHAQRMRGSYISEFGRTIDAMLDRDKSRGI